MKSNLYIFSEILTTEKCILVSYINIGAVKSCVQCVYPVMNLINSGVRRGERAKLTTIAIQNVEFVCVGLDCTDSKMCNLGKKEPLFIWQIFIV